MNEHIFRKYDIRGVVTQDLTPDIVTDLGRALGTFFIRNNASEMVLGRDCRLSSDGLRDQLTAGLLETGMHVIDIGVCHSPLVYFSLYHLEKNAGVMITGSHNPADFNGFKICLGKTTIHGDQIQELKQLIVSGDFERGAGTVAHVDVLTDYIDWIAENITLGRTLKVVIDAGNGTGGQAALPLLARLGCEVIPLYCDMDGRFPNHHPDPTVTDNLQDLITAVREQGADLGIGYDGDADRIGVVDERGSIIWGDQLMIVFARDILREVPGATFISEVKGSQNLYREVERLGGRAIMWKTGHSLIKAKMKETQAVLAGEMSGHMFFAHRYFGFDDAIYATCRLLEIVAAGDVPLSGLLAGIPETHTTPEIRIDCPDCKKHEVIDRFKDAVRQRYSINDIDGARIDMPGGWGLVRASNTQPVLVLRFEARSPDRLREIRNEIEAQVLELIAAT